MLIFTRPYVENGLTCARQTAQLRGLLIADDYETEGPIFGGFIVVSSAEELGDAIGELLSRLFDLGDDVEDDFPDFTPPPGDEYRWN